MSGGHPGLGLAILGYYFFVRFLRKGDEALFGSFDGRCSEN